MAEPSKKEEQEAKKKQEGEKIIATDLAARDSAKRLFSFQKALESNELIGQIVNKAPPVQNDSSLADQMHRIFVDWSLVFEQSVFRYPETDTAYGQRFVQADKVAEESKQKRQRGQMAVLRSLILKDRR
ncbi:hypothetical protein OC835_008060, partial [Tilletia horrida]